MAITDELRGFMDGADGYELWCPRHKVELENIADHIDAAHCKALGETAAAAYAEGAESVPIAIDESQWVKLPVDADGVPIRVGDVMEVKFDTKRRPFTVSFVGERAVAFWVVGQPDLKSFNLDTVLVTHHHTPTVEDVLREFARECDADAYGVTDAKVAEFAARLRLAGSDAE